jgi:predicted GNAT superfamily acetyltransferase
MRKNFVKAYIWSIALYGRETWIIGDAERRLEAGKVWYCRRMMRIRWVDRVANKEIFRRTGEKRRVYTHLNSLRSKLD